MNSRDSSSTADGSSPASTSTPNARPTGRRIPRGSYRGFVGDVSDEDFVKASVADIAKIGHIDLLINNAGQPSFQTPTAYEAADVDKCLKGLKGMILWCVQTLKACDEQNLKIANVMSTAATRRQRQRIRVLRHQMG